MYAVTQDFIERMRADKRRVEAKVVIDYTDPTVSNEIQVTTTDRANISYPQQTADGIIAATHKWASLDGTWRLDQDYRLAPLPGDLYRYQFGWWSASISGADGAFPAPYPSLIVTHPPRPIYVLRVVGDSARGEWPVDFIIRLKDQNGNTLYTETVTGNTTVDWQKPLATVNGVARQELEIRRWSHPGRNAKILEFFTSFQETYYSDDIVEIKLLEEREASQGSLPVGNISANEVTIRLANEGGKFDPTNPNNPLFRLLKPNRRIKAWLGAIAENLASTKAPTFTRNSVAYLSDGTQVAAGQPRFEQGVYGQAVMVEEGTTNLVKTNAGADPHFNSTAGWALFNATITNGVLTLQSPDGSAVSMALCTFTNLAQNTKFSFYVRARYRDSSGVAKELWLDLYDYATGYDFAEQEMGVGVDQLTTTFQNFKKEGFDSQTVPSSVRLRIFTFSTRPIEVDFVQLEQKPYATSFTDSTRSPEILTIPTAGVLNPQEGTVECWVYVNDVVKRADGVYRVIWYALPVGGVANGWLVLDHFGNSANWGIAVSNGTTTSAYTISDSYTPNGWHLFSLTFNKSDGSIRLLIDGVLRFNTTGAPLPSSYDKLFVGLAQEGTRQCNTIIDDLRISSRARADEEIAAAYASGQPLPVDEWTTWKQTFNGSIYPVEQVWIPLGTFWSLDWDSPDDTMEASVTARDRLELLRKSTYQPGGVQRNVSLYTLAEQVLIDAGLKAGEYWIDPALQQTVILWAWLQTSSHREALRTIAEAALAVVYADRDGVVRVETVGATPDEPGLTITADDYFPPLRAPSRQDQVANEIVVTTQPLRPAATPQEVYRSTTPVSVPAGNTVTVTAFYTQQPVIEAAASLDAPPAGVSIAGAAYYAWGADVRIQNTGGSAANVTLVVTGKPLSVQGSERVVARDEQSILENGTLRYEYPANPLVQTISQARTIAHALLASVKDPRRDIEVEWRGNPALELGDRVTVVGQDVHVIRQEIEWAGALSTQITGRKVT